MFTIDRSALHRLIDELTETEIRSAAQFLNELHGEDEGELVAAGAASAPAEWWYGDDVLCSD